MKLDVAPEALRMVAAVGLPDPAAADTQPSALTDELISFAVAHRVQGLVWEAIDGGALVGPDELVDRARESYLAGLHTCLLAEDVASRAFDALDAAHIECRALKGIAMAHLDYPDPSQRMFGDADILVRPERHAAALAALEVAGFARAEPSVRASWERRFGKAVVLRAPNHGELDLHLRITGGYFGERIHHPALWSDPGETFELAGRTTVALAREARLLHACCHVALGGGSGLRAERDVAQLLLLAGADWQATVNLATANSADAVVARAVRTTWSSLYLDPRHPAAVWAGAHEAAPEHRRALATYDAAFTGGWGPEGRGVLSALGSIDRVRFLLGLAVPSRASMRARGRTWRQHLVQGASSLRRRT